MFMESMATCAWNTHAVIAGSIYLTLAVSYWFYPIALVLIGSGQRTFANILHEAAHFHFAKNRLLNFIGGTVLTSYLIFHMFTPYRNSHVGFHHRHFGDPENDPDYNFHILLGLYEAKESHAQFIWKNLILALIGYRSWEYIKYIYHDRILFSEDKVVIRMPISITTDRLLFAATWIMVLSLVAWFNVWLEFLLFWIVPCFTTYIAIGWCAELAEHYPLPESEDRRLLMTRNRKGWAIENFLFGRHNDRYHLVHHIFPTIPFCNLKRAHDVLLQDDAYRQWDAMWGGIFTRRHPDEETLISYVKKYKAEVMTGNPASPRQSFAERLLVQHPLAQGA
jgi:fatty acid desaturase